MGQAGICLDVGCCRCGGRDERWQLDGREYAPEQIKIARIGKSILIEIK